MPDTADTLNRPTVVLVHGGMLGAWCWDEVISSLSAFGLDVRAVDLPIEDNQAGAAVFTETVVRAAADLPSVVVVGHSLSGAFLPLVACHRPVQHMIFVCAALPLPGRSMAEQFAADPALMSEAQKAFQFDEAGRFRMSAEDAKRVYFHDCPGDVAERAAARLRPQSSLIATETSPLAAWPQVPLSYVLCTEDRAMPPDWARRVVPERLNATPIEIAGGHAPFLSRPGVLAEIIARITLTPR
jgi:pimeloyl-ACP methyl ester carboxylesterase